MRPLTLLWYSAWACSANFRNTARRARDAESVRCRIRALDRSDVNETAWENERAKTVSFHSSPGNEYLTGGYSRPTY